MFFDVDLTFFDVVLSFFDVDLTFAPSIHRERTVQTHSLNGSFSTFDPTCRRSKNIPTVGVFLLYHHLFPSNDVHAFARSIETLARDAINGNGSILRWRDIAYSHCFFSSEIMCFLYTRITVIISSPNSFKVSPHCVRCYVIVVRS